MAAAETIRETIAEAQPILPPGDSHPSDPKALTGSGESFFSGSNSDQDDRMPTDDKTGLPFPILPTYPSRYEIRQANNYHHHFYDRRHADLEGPVQQNYDQLAEPETIPLEILAGVAVRKSRGQVLPLATHAELHKLFPIGPELPHTLDEKFITVVRACSGLVSLWAIDVTAPSSDKLVRMDKRTFDAVAQPKLLCFERGYYDRPANHRRKIIGTFLVKYALDKHLETISDDLIEKFLSPRTDLERVGAGNAILKQTVAASIEPMTDSFSELKFFGMVQPGKKDMLTSIRKLLHPDRSATMHDLIEKKLLTAA